PRGQKSLDLPQLRTHPLRRGSPGSLPGLRTSKGILRAQSTELLIVSEQNSHQAKRGRSEEHTSELQSRFDLVCRLLLEIKKSKAQAVSAGVVGQARGDVAGRVERAALVAGDDVRQQLRGGARHPQLDDLL